MNPEDIDFSVSYDWARHYNPSLPPIDDRTPRERQADEWVAKAMAAIEAEANGSSLCHDTSLEERVKSLERAIAEMRQCQRGTPRTPAKKGFDLITPV